MKKNIFYVLLVLLVVGFILLAIRFLSGPEDNWICQNGSWVKHGQPVGEAPTTACPGYEKKDQIDNKSNEQDVAENMVLKIYFSNSQKNPEMQDCGQVYSVERIVPKTLGVARAALEQLFIGPTLVEKKDGYFSNLNGNIKINKLTIENGVAKADFSEELNKDVGGSCRVSAIRAQIEQTLKQFATVNSVIISVNGESETILQP